MSDKFPPKNSGFRLETFRFPSDVTPCRHAIYHHGCPSCDERDPEGDDNDLVVGAPTREDGDSPTGAGYTPTTDFVLAAAEKVMDPILRTWFAYDCAPHEVEHYAENAAVDLSWALQNAGLLASHFDALLARLDAAEAALAPEGVVTLNGKRWRVVRFTSDSGGKDARLVPYRPEDTNG